MSDLQSAAPPRFFQPLSLLLGVLVGLLLLTWAGRTVSRENWHRNFVRFHPLIAGESHYQPTVAEMAAIVRSRCHPDQILVIVGGNSIFQGVGQPVEKLWTRRLQDLLGERYAVVNLAFRGSSPSDGGALAAEALRREFPRQIYLANVAPFTAASPAGNLDYRYMVLDATHKNLLLDHRARADTIKDYLAHPDRYPSAREDNLGARLDAWLYFREFWNWVTVTRFSTFPTPLTSDLARAFLPRNAFADAEPDFEMMPFQARFPASVLATEMEIIRNNSAQFYREAPGGNWMLNESAYAVFRNYAIASFPEKLRARTFIVLSRNSPYYTRQLSPTERVRDNLAYLDSVRTWRELGFASIDYGSDFTSADYGDRTHLSAAGGRRLAEVLAPEIRSLASKLGYPNP